MRTTLDLDPAVLEELKRRRAIEGQPMGTIASQLLRQAMAAQPHGRSAFVWASQPLEIRGDLDDKDAMRRTVDGR